MTAEDSGIVLTSTVATELPKSTTADDLLSMYAEEEGSSDVTESAGTDTTAQNAAEKSLIPEAGIIKAKDGDAEIRIPETTKFSVEINGKSVEVTQKDAIQALVKQEEFNRNMDSRLGKASNKERQIDGAFQNLLGIAGKVSALAEKGDMLAVNRELAKIAANGTELDIVSWERKFFEENAKFYQAYAKLSPEQIDRFFFERKAQLNEDQLKSIRERDNSQRELGQLENTVKELQSSYQIDNKEFWGTYELIVKELVGPGKAFESDKHVKPEDVVEQTLLNRRYDRIYKAANNVGLDNEEVIDELASMTAGKDDYTAEDFEELIKRSGILDNLASPNAVENLNRKVQKSGLKPKSASSTKKERNTEGLDKEDLDFLYRRQPKQYKPIIRR